MSSTEKKKEGAPQTWIPFEYYQYEASTRYEESGEGEVVDVAYKYRAQIIEPEPGKRIGGRIVTWSCRDDGTLYSILNTRDGFFAFRTDTDLVGKKILHYEMRAITLDEPHRPLAWEVYRPTGTGHWTPVDGQLLRSRTALAEVWLQELDSPLNRLKDQERVLQETQQSLLPTPAKIEESRQIVLSPTGSMPPTGRWIGSNPKGPHGSLETGGKLKEIETALTAVRGELERAQKVVAYLQQQSGRYVTLQPSAIEGRNAEVMPKLLPKEKLSLAISDRPRIRL